MALLLQNKILHFSEIHLPIRQLFDRCDHIVEFKYWTVQKKISVWKKKKKIQNAKLNTARRPERSGMTTSSKDIQLKSPSQNETDMANIDSTNF